jgi:hypothetical protein
MYEWTDVDQGHLGSEGLLTGCIAPQQFRMYIKIEKTGVAGKIVLNWILKNENGRSRTEPDSG